MVFWMFYGGTQLLLYNLDDSAAAKSLYISHSVSYMYRGSPTSRVSDSTNSTSSNFSAIGIKFVLVELLCNKICTNGNWLGMYYPLVQISLVGSFPGPKICTKRGPPVP